MTTIDHSLRSFKVFVTGPVLCGLLLGSVFSSQEAMAADRAMRIGLSKKEVLEILGPPQSKIEKETKRMSAWHYPKKRVLTFQEGKLLQDSKGSLPSTPTAEKENSNTAATNKNFPFNKASTTASPRQKKLSFTGSDVFDEISKLKSSDGDSGSSKNARVPSAKRKR